MNSFDDSVHDRTQNCLTDCVDLLLDVLLPIFPGVWVINLDAPLNSTTVRNLEAIGQVILVARSVSIFGIWCSRQASHATTEDIN